MICRNLFFGPCLVLALLGACRQKDAAAPAGFVPSIPMPPRAAIDTMLTDSAVIEARFPKVRRVFAAHSLPLLGVQISPERREPRFEVDLGAATALRKFDRFKALLMDMCKALKWKKDFQLADTAKKVLAEVFPGDIQAGGGGLIYTDSLLWIEPPRQELFPQGNKRIALTTEGVGMDVAPEPAFETFEPSVDEPGRHTGCLGMVGVNGRLYYSLYRFEVIVDDPETGESHSASVDFPMVDAIDGSVWSSSRFNPSFNFRGSGRNTVYLRRTLHPSPSAWETISSNCAEINPVVWQYRPSDHRLQRLGLYSLQVEREILLDTAGLEGELMDVSEIRGLDDSIGDLFLLVKTPKGHEVFRSLGSRIFAQRWLITDPAVQSMPQGFRVVAQDAAHPKTLVLRFGEARFVVDSLRWESGSTR